VLSGSLYNENHFLIGIALRSLILLTIFASAPLRADFTWAEAEIEGLTCSMCAKSVELKVRDLDFVEDVKMDLVATKMRVDFKEHSHVDVRSIADAIDDAGFSVGTLKAAFVFDGLRIEEGKCVELDDKPYSFLKTGSRTLKGETVLKFLGEGYLPKSELAKWKPLLTDNCGEKSGTPNNFVTIP
jgi:copper chaperone CopZ